MANLRILKAEEVVDLRHRVLRSSSPISEAVYELDNDKDTIHLGIVGKSGSVMAIASFFLENEKAEKQSGVYRLRGMAVEPEMQSKGYGTILLNFAVSMLQSKGASMLWCNARTSASDFYMKQGFVVDGDEFEMTSIGPHYRMKLKL